MALLVGSCKGIIEPADQHPDDGFSDGQGEPTDGFGQGPLEPHAVVMRRLTRAEYNFTIEDLLGIADRPGDGFPSEERVEGFDNNARALTLPPALAEGLFHAAGQLAQKAVADRTRWAACLSTDESSTCAAEFVRAFGRRAWRRPLAAEEVERFLSLREIGDDPVRGLALIVQAMLIAPPFLFRVEHGDGTPVEGASHLMRPTSWEMASRLSYLLWASMPDETLFAAAERDELRDPEAIQREARRMLRDDRSSRMMKVFHRQWLELEGVHNINKDPEVYPHWDDVLGRLFLEETERFVVDLLRSARPLGDLLIARHSFLNERLGAHYGVPVSSGESFTRVELPRDSGRIGFLTQGSFLANQAAFDQTSPTLRGVFVRERLLCEHLPPPPPDVADTPSAPSELRTTRQRTEAHATDPACSGCHRLIDPIGFGFERFDGTGARRDTENGVTIDDRGEVVNTSIGAFEGAEELAQDLAELSSFRHCLATQWAKFAFGRRESELTASDHAALKTIAEQADTSYEALVLALVQTEAFQFLPLATADRGTP